MQKEQASAAEDAAKAMAESAAEKKRADKLKKALSLLETKYEKAKKALDKKPKEVIVEVEKVVEREVPVEVEKIKEKIVEKPVEVEKIVEVVKEVQVPGPERLVVRTDNSKLDKLSNDNQNLKKIINDLQKQVSEKPKEIEKIVEVEKIVEKPVEIEKAATGDLREAARLMAASELNKEDLTENEIFDLLQKSSEEDVRKKIGFWAQPLPTDTDDNPNKIYISKK
jgi:hypothetical protein